MRVLCLLVVLMASLTLVTSTDDEGGVVALDGEGVGAVPDLLGGIDMNHLRAAVRKTVIKAVAVRRDKTQYKKTLDQEKEIEDVKTLNELNAQIQNTASPSSQDEDAVKVKTVELKKHWERTKMEAVAAERQKLNHGKIEKAVELMVQKDSKGNQAAEALLEDAQHPEALSQRDTHIMQQSELNALDEAKDEAKDDHLANDETQKKALSVTKVALKAMESQAQGAIGAIAKHIGSDLNKKDVSAAIEKELEPALASIAKRVGNDVVSGKYNGADFNMNGTVVPTTKAEDEQIQADKNVEEAEESKIKELDSVIARTKGEEDANKRNGTMISQTREVTLTEEISHLKKAKEQAKEKLETAKETTKEILAQNANQRISTEEEDQLSIASTKQKLDVLNHAVQNKQNIANEKMAKGAIAKKYAVKMEKKARRLANEQAWKSKTETAKKMREIVHKADETKRKAALEKQKIKMEADRMQDEAEQIARDSGLPGIAKGQPGYGVMRATGRAREQEKELAAKAAAEEKKIKAIPPVLVDNSIHVHMERNEPKGGYKAGGIWG